MNATHLAVLAMVLMPVCAWGQQPGLTGECRFVTQDTAVCKFNSGLNSATPETAEPPQNAANSRLYQDNVKTGATVIIGGLATLLIFVLLACFITRRDR